MGITARTVLHGIDESGLSSKKPANPNHASLFWQEDVLHHEVYDQGLGKWLPVEFLRFKYDVSGGDSGATGTKTLTALPAGIIILDGIIDVITTFTSANDSATIALKAKSTGDLVSAIAISDSSNPWDAGLHAIVPDGTVTNAIKIATDGNIVLTVGTQAVTAGKLYGFLRFVRSLTT
ncbi:MAG TPA: hypothetical protein VG713_06910 [Pirellulales bacterium]|nr:hypothetical protein [Pirellulales bacterium]